MRNIQKIPLTNAESLSYMIRNKKNILDKIDRYSFDRSTCNEYNVQGYCIKAINIKNASKAIRSILGGCGFNPNITSKKYDLAILELERKVNSKLQ